MGDASVYYQGCGWQDTIIDDFRLTISVNLDYIYIDHVGSLAAMAL